MSRDPRARRTATQHPRTPPPSVSRARPTPEDTLSEAARASLRTLLVEGQRTLAIDLPEAAIDQLLDYLSLLLRWNRVYNLTAVRDPAAMAVQHLLDSLAAVPALRRHTGRQAGRLLDVGSGGGLPGVVWAAACPEQHVTCVDTVGKKVSFVRQVAAELRLPNLAAEHSRVEALRLPAFPLITARAFAALPDIVRWTEHALAPGGAWLAMKGLHPADEIAALPPHIDVFHVEPLHVPGLDAERCIVWMRRREEPHP